MSLVDVDAVLFVCVENAGRSQMAEAFFKKHAPGRFRVSSAGTRPARQLDPVVVQAMGEVGIRLPGKPKILAGKNIPASTRIVNMGCMDRGSCPALFAGGAEDWDIPDPRGRSLDEVRIIRDQVESKVRELAARLSKGHGPVKR